ncbi:hypothetical protein MTR67_006784 [Solanum verrucosum]|uniref:Uncharacterized protein n=1 Tax=Solanum verrucosum TaxID=315347 RepID=A0AAF0Q4R7_SOLVR|nr:hypothetical protein MTR67_006784 [Solanum verrucosum]
MEDSLRWYDEERSNDGKLRHPAYGLASKDFDRLHPNFTLDSRNVRIGLSSDGFNPFWTMSISHSTWPVMLMVYNLPPWMCMKFEYCILSLLIPGPRSPGNDIDIYLQPLIDELKLLWDSRIETYDASRNQTFQMRAALMWTIDDVPAYVMLSGWSTKEKNIVDIILGTLLDISGKTKDHAKARYDLKDIGIRKDLHPKDTEDNKRTKFAKACFSMTNGEKSFFCGVLKTAKLLDGSASNISRCLQLDERKLSCYKTHDAHFMLHYLLPIPIKSILPDHVTIPLIRLSSFFCRLCQNVITLEELDCLEVEIIETINQLERIFLPTFFYIMIHLPIHLANEVRLRGPVQNRWMYSTEREMGTFKSYIRNRCYPEGCIAETRVGIDCMNLFSKYLHRGMHTRFNKRARNNDECDPSDAEIVSLFPNKGVLLGAKKTDPLILDNKSLSQAHAYLLGNCDEVQEYIREHEQEVNNQPQRSKWSKAKSHCQNFSQWFETRALQEDVPDLIKQLSRGPNYVAKRYSGYLINGYRFHVRQRDAWRKTQNSGVTLVASTTSFANSKDKNLIAADLTYYGRIVDIVELDYFGHFKVVLFKCDWYEVENDTYGLTYVYFNKRCSQEEPFVLGSQVHQCFYVQDPYDQDRHYVMKTVPRDLFNMSDQVESNLPQSYENEPSEHLMGPSIPKDSGEVLLTRTDVPETIIDVPSEEFVTQQLEVEYEEELENESADEFEDKTENEYEDGFENEYEDELEDESEEEFEDDAP